MVAKDTKKELQGGAVPLDIDRDLLTQADLDALEAEVKAEAEEEAREEARKRVKAKMRAEARRKKGLEEAQEEVTIDLAPYCDRLLIDNVAYLQGISYTVRVSLAMVLREQMQRTWNHQAEIDGKPSTYNRHRNTRFSAATGAVTNGPNVNTTSSILRA
jgi:hypothetical protein